MTKCYITKIPAPSLELENARRIDSALEGLRNGGHRARPKPAVGSDLGYFPILRLDCVVGWRCLAFRSCAPLLAVSRGTPRCNWDNSVGGCGARPLARPTKPD